MHMDMEIGWRARRKKNDLLESLTDHVDVSFGLETFLAHLHTGVSFSAFNEIVASPNGDVARHGKLQLPALENLHFVHEFLIGR